MLRKIGMLGLLSTTLVGIHQPFVWADEATVQTSTQQATIIGDKNRVIQINTQNSINRTEQDESKWKNRKGRAIGHYQDRRQKNHED